MSLPLDRVPDAARTARLEIRTTPEQKALIEAAAALLGDSVTSFVLATALRDAMKVVREAGRTELSLRDWKLFHALLEADAEPAPALREAMRAYRSDVERSDGL